MQVNPVNTYSHSLHLQISDWLNLEQNMLKNYHVDVGDSEAIAEAIDKQKVSSFSFFTHNESV